MTLREVLQGCGYDTERFMNLLDIEVGETSKAGISIDVLIRQRELNLDIDLPVLGGESREKKDTTS